MNPNEREQLARFANCQIGLHELAASLRGMIEIDFGPSVRSVTSHFLVSEPGIRIEPRHIVNAISKCMSGEISSEELKHWATMIRLNDAYEWVGPDEEEIADRLDELSMPQIFVKDSGKLESPPLQ
jgi:hypothetical protein